MLALLSLKKLVLFKVEERVKPRALLFECVCTSVNLFANCLYVSSFMQKQQHRYALLNLGGYLDSGIFKHNLNF